MSTTKRAKLKGEKLGKRRVGGMSIGAIIVAVIGTILLAVALLSRPDIFVFKGVPVVTQGIIAPAIVLGVIFWSMIEYFTPPGKNIGDLLVRIIPAFLIGGFVGGYLGYEFKFGAYVLVPALDGNTRALFFLASVLIAALIVTWNAAWSHTHGFRGQKSQGTHFLSGRESGTHKGSRGILALLIIFLVFLMIVPIGAQIGTTIASGHQAVLNEGLNPSLPTQTQALAVRDRNTSVPVVNRYYIGQYCQEFDMPTHEVKNATGYNITTFYHSAYVTTYLTVNDFNEYAVTQYQLSFCNPITANITFGIGVNIQGMVAPGFTSGGGGGVIGSAAVVNPFTSSPSSSTVFNGTNATTFQPIETLYLNNTEYANFTVSPYMMLGNQTDSITYEIHGNVTTPLCVDSMVIGNPSGITVFWPYSMIQGSYILGGIVVLGASILGMAFVDIGPIKKSKINGINGPSKTKGKGKKGR
jgi:hypothetical protein